MPDGTTWEPRFDRNWRAASLLPEQRMWEIVRDLRLRPFQGLQNSSLAGPGNIERASCNPLASPRYLPCTFNRNPLYSGFQSHVTESLMSSQGFGN
jgi:hypothetical protein